MTCGRFWRLVHGSRSPGAGAAPRSVLGRLGFLPLGSDALDDLVVAPKLYHHAKFGGSLNELRELVQTNQLRTLATAMKHVVQAARYSTQRQFSHVFGLRQRYSQYVRNIFATCSQHVRSMSALRSQHFRIEIGKLFASA